MTYLNDELWKRSKQIARESGEANNWIEIAHCYHTLGGSNTRVMAIMDDTKLEIAYVVDTPLGDSECVLLVDKDNNSVVKEYTEVLEANKLFYYVTGKQEDRVIYLPEGQTYLGDNKVVIKR